MNPSNVYLVIWAGYVHRGVFTTRERAEAFIEVEQAKPDSWGFHRIEELPLDPDSEDPQRRREPCT